MSGLFKGATTPPPVIIPPAPPPVPTPMPDLASNAALEAARKKALAQMQGGRESTILSGKTGLGSGAAAAPAAGGDYTAKKLGA
jgi:hypothetical protein